MVSIELVDLPQKASCLVLDEVQWQVMALPPARLAYIPPGVGEGYFDLLSLGGCILRIPYIHTRYRIVEHVVLCHHCKLLEQFT